MSTPIHYNINNMNTIINFLNKWGTVAWMCVTSILFICALICNLSMVCATISLWISIPGLVGSLISLGINIYLLIKEIKEIKGWE